MSTAQPDAVDDEWADDIATLRAAGLDEEADAWEKAAEVLDAIEVSP